jgi:VanZ family protein
MRFLKAWLPVIVWAALILFAANDALSNDTTAGWLERLFGSPPPALNFLLRKTAHVVEYAILALLAWRAHRTFVIPLTVVLVVAIADETLQSQTALRTGNPFDVLLDLCAAMLALIAVPAVRALLSSRRDAH